jgi:hypothetical protein
MSLCLDEVKGEPYPDRVAGILSLSAGVPMTTVSPAPSLLVTRALSKSIGKQMYIPKRFLAGIIPTALVETYIFWQNEDDQHLIGYEDSNANNDDDTTNTTEDTGPSSRLKIVLTKDPQIFHVVHFQLLMFSAQQDWRYPSL